MKFIPIYNSTEVVIVDDEDFEKLKGFKWTLTSGYARRTKGGIVNIFLHHEVIGHVRCDQVVDHKNRNKLDCQRHNLRFVDQGTNTQNSKLFKNNQSGFTGVTKVGERYYARIFHNKKLISLGGARTAELAAIEYDKAALKLYGPYAKLNFPMAENCEFV